MSEGRILTDAELLAAMAKIFKSTEGVTVQEGGEPIAFRMLRYAPEPEVIRPEKNRKRLRNISRWRQ